MNSRSPSFDLGAVLEMHRDDGGLEPRLQRDAGDRRHRSDRIDIDRHRLALGLGQLRPETTRGRCGALGAGAAAHPRRAGRHKPASPRQCRRTPATTIKLRFFMSSSRPAGPAQGPATVSFLPLDGDFCALFLNGYHSALRAPWYASSTAKMCGYTDPESDLMRIATWNVNSVRQRLDHLADLAAGLRARRRLPAGNQMRRRGLPARRRSRRSATTSSPTARRPSTASRCCRNCRSTRPSRAWPATTRTTMPASSKAWCR